MMRLTTLTIPEVLIFEPRIFEDSRGLIFESFNMDQFQKATSLKIYFVQDNYTKSMRGVLRGLHYQIGSHAQGKLISVLDGEILDVAVDLRKSSPTFGQYITEILSSDNKKQMWIPEGFAHGFLTLSATSEVTYKLTNYYHLDSERTILWNDTTLNIGWPQNIEIKVSAKDSLGLSFLEAGTFP
jgi:dTDP-4-dehydrorhamnose 3,5-epimerase